MLAPLRYQRSNLLAPATEPADAKNLLWYFHNLLEGTDLSPAEAWLSAAKKPSLYAITVILITP
ncbi:MAG: hypothetical protein K0U41_06410 [Gammaproteobacteria bacterium]|nr:hypothetical protein [Gammaproteobacteria bacterium]